MNLTDVLLHDGGSESFSFYTPWRIHTSITLCKSQLIKKRNFSPFQLRDLIIYCCCILIKQESLVSQCLEWVDFKMKIHFGRNSKNFTVRVGDMWNMKYIYLSTCHHLKQNKRTHSFVYKKNPDILLSPLNVITWKETNNSLCTRQHEDRKESWSKLTMQQIMYRFSVDVMSQH